MDMVVLDGTRPVKVPKLEKMLPLAHVDGAIAQELVDSFGCEDGNQRLNIDSADDAGVEDAHAEPNPFQAYVCTRMCS